jgi:hypothetical protein
VNRETWIDKLRVTILLRKRLAEWLNVIEEEVEAPALDRQHRRSRTHFHAHLTVKVMAQGMMRM